MSGPMTGKQQQLALRKCGAGAGGTWDTAVACGAGNGILFLSGQAAASADSVTDKSRGRAFAIDATKGPLTCEPTYKLSLRYVGFEVLAALLMGAAGVPAQQGGTAAYLHTLKWNPDVYGYMCTIAKNMVNYVEEVPTAKITGITISGQVGAEPLSVDLDVVGSRKEVASLVNTLATWANVTIPTGGDRNPVMFAHSTFLMNAQSGAALAIGDRIYPGSFSLAIKRPLKGEFTGAYRTSGSNPQDLIDEPSTDGEPEIKLTLTMPTHTSSARLVDMQNDARKKMSISFTGGLIASTYYFNHTWQFPHLQMLNTNPTDDDGRIKEPLEFNALGCLTAPTGMTGCTDPLWWLITSTLATDPLA